MTSPFRTIYKNYQMSQINNDITIYNSPFFENLVSEFYRISRYKRNIYKNIRNEEDYQHKLSIEEKAILQALLEKENTILFEILCYKRWLDSDSINKSVGLPASFSEKEYFVHP